MAFFKRILNFKEFGVGSSDKRGNTRYPVGLKFPLKAKINLAGRDGEGKALPANDRRSMDWGGQLVDLSTTGASIRLHPSALASRGENCSLKLELSDTLFEIDATIAHFRLGKQYVTCGVLLRFSDANSQKAYRQLLEPVVIGATMAAVPAKDVKQDAPGLNKEQYAGDENSVLTVWRNANGGAIEYFEMLMHDYYVRGTAQTTDLAIGYRDGAKVGKRVSTPSIPIPLPPAPTGEVLKLFKWIVPNLSKAVADDAKEFLQKLAG